MLKLLLHSQIISVKLTPTIDIGDWCNYTMYIRDHFSTAGINLAGFFCCVLFFYGLFFFFFEQVSTMFLPKNRHLRKYPGNKILNI